MLPGQVVADRFEIEALAGAGGMGVVYRARDRAGGGLVALKLLHDSALAHDARFAREAALLADVAVPGVVRYIAHGTTGEGRPYLAMEWLEGDELRARLQRAGLTVEETVTLGIRVAEALSQLHRRGIVHRDIKPGNIFLVGGSIEHPKLLDFGLARATASSHLTGSGVPLGTPGYMAPEQARAERNIDARADVFSLGCVLYKCLTGQAAFDADDVLGVLLKVVLEEPPLLEDLRPDIPAALAALVDRMLSKPRGERPADAGAVAAALSALERPLIGAPAPTSRRSNALTATERRVVCLLVGTRLRKPTEETTLDVENAVTSPDLDGPPADTETSERALRSLVGDAGGRLDLLADGSMLITLSSLEAATDLAALGARCALVARRMAPRACLAMVTGRSLLTPHPVGALIDRAVGLLAGAAPPAIRLDDVSAGLLDGRFLVLADSDGFLLLAEREKLAARTVLGRATPFVGRERELRLLEELMEECVSSRSARVALVVGEAGAGKSRLAYELLTSVRARGDVGVLSGRGDPMTRASPLATVAGVIRRACGMAEREALPVRQRRLRARVARTVAPEDQQRVTEFLGEVTDTRFDAEQRVQLRAARADPQLMADQVQRAWEDFLAAESRAGPLFLLLEDLHWCDAASVRSIDAALRTLRQSPTMVLALARPEIHDHFPNAFAARDLTQLRLSPLSHAASEQLAAHVLGPDVPRQTLERLAAQAAGNPFFLEELMRAVAQGAGDTLPDTVVAMLQSRLELLDADARRVLRAASIFGRMFWSGGVEALLGAPAQSPEVGEVLRSLWDRELIAPRQTAAAGEQAYAFRHALVREAAYAMLTEEDEQLGHRLAAQWLERRGQGDPISVAEHFVRGGEPKRAVACFHRAAEQALAAHDLSLVISLAVRAVDSGAEGDELGALRVLQARAHGWRHEHALARARALEALEHLPAGSVPASSAIYTVVTAAIKLGDRPQAVTLALEQRDLLLRTEPSPEQLSLACSTARQLFLAGELDLARQLVELVESLAIGVQQDSPTMRAQLASMRAKEAQHAGDLSAMELEQEAAEWFDRAGDVRAASIRRINAAHFMLELGAWADAERTLSQAIVAAERLGLASLVDACKQNLPLALLELGRADEAMAIERQTVGRYAAQRDARCESGSRAYLARILARTGQLEEAEREARAAVALLEPTAPLRPAALATLAQVLLDRGRADEALAPAREAFDALDHAEEGESLILLVHAQALHAAGDPNRAREAIARALSRVNERAAKIRSRKWRESFLRVPENLRIAALAEQWS